MPRASPPWCSARWSGRRTRVSVPITDAEREAVIEASKNFLETDYNKTIDRESAYEILQKRTAERADAEAAPANETAGTKKAGGGSSRSDSFWTTLGKTLIKTGVPLATRVLTDALKGRNRRRRRLHGFGARTLEAVPVHRLRIATAKSADEKYVPFKSINVVERGILGGRKRQ